MKAGEYADIAESFSSVSTCYMLGGYGQKLTQATYNYLCGKYPKNKTYGNQKYVGSNTFPLDCICFVKALCAGLTAYPVHRIEYEDIKKTPMGDITNDKFLALMKKNNGVEPKYAKRGMGLANKSHAAIALGDGMWVDANKWGSQNGVVIHKTGIEQFDIAGEIPGIDYSDEQPQVGDTIPMVITKIEDGIAYGQAQIGPSPKIVVGSQVTIDPGAVAGGLSTDPKTGRGVPIAADKANGKYVDTVEAIETHYGVEEALLKGIKTWVALSSLNLVS